MNREEIIKKQAEGMRALSEEELKELARKQAEGMRCMSMEEMAQRQREGMMNFYAEEYQKAQKDNT